MCVPPVGGLLGLLAMGKDILGYKDIGPHAGPVDPRRGHGLHLPLRSSQSFRSTSVLCPPRAALEAL